MRTIDRTIRKLGLGNAAIALSRPFLRPEICEMDTETGRAILEAVYPDKGGSCLRETPLKAGKTETSVDIIMPAYNVAAYLRECLDSVCTQKTSYPFRILAVDDGSTDGTAELLDEYAAADGRIEVLHEKNGGPGRARNRAIERSEAKYLYFADADDRMAPGAIERLVNCAEENGADITEGAYRIIDLNGRTRRTMPHKSGEIKPTKVCFGFPWGKLFRREIFADIKFPEGLWFEDSINAHVIFPRLEQNGGKAFGVEDCVCFYRVNPKGITQGGKTSAKSLDALWAHLSLYRDRKKLGLQDTQGYYEYMLNMMVSAYRRTEFQPEEVKRAMFTMWAAFMEREFAAFRTERKAYRILEDAARRRDYGQYSLFCRLA